jgi:ribosomal protein L22
MSKPSRPRDLADTEAQAILSNVRVSPRKLNLVAGLIRNLPAQQAVATLTFSKRCRRRSPTPRTIISSTSIGWWYRAPKWDARWSCAGSTRVAAAARRASKNGSAT